MTEMFTRQQILDAIALRPCHVTGMHDPRHTPKYVCTLQLADSLQRLLELLEIKVEDLPRELHETCYWCHGDADRREEPKQFQEWVATGRK